MMGLKIRHFAPLPDLSLEELVPEDNFYRRLQKELDLSFVRDLVKPSQAEQLTNLVPDRLRQPTQVSEA